APDPSKSADERLAVEGLELVEAGAVDEAGNDLAGIDLLAEGFRDEAVKVRGIGGRRLGRRDVPRWLRRGQVEVANDLAGDGEGMLVGRRVVVGDARLAGVHVRAGELLRRHLLARGRLHERGTADE